MTREQFIKKWLGNKDYQYTEQNRDLMRDDLDKVINKALPQADVSGSIDVPPTRVRFWRNIHDDTTVAYGSVIDQTETHYIVVPDDDVRPTVKWSKDRCDVLR
jgi:hypothetical protein